MEQNITRIRHCRHLPAWLLERLPSAALENAPMADQDQPQTTRDDVNRRFDEAYQRLDQRFNRQTATMLAIAARHPLGPGRLRRGRQRAYESYRSHRPTCRAIPVRRPLMGRRPIPQLCSPERPVPFRQDWSGGRRRCCIGRSMERRKARLSHCRAPAPLAKMRVTSLFQTSQTFSRCGRSAGFRADLLGVDNVPSMMSN